jgi:hypothetical protein
MKNWFKGNFGRIFQSKLFGNLYFNIIFGAQNISIYVHNHDVLSFRVDFSKLNKFGKNPFKHCSEKNYPASLNTILGFRRPKITLKTYFYSIVINTYYGRN